MPQQPDSSIPPPRARPEGEQFEALPTGAARVRDAQLLDQDRQRTTTGWPVR